MKWLFPILLSLSGCGLLGVETIGDGKFNPGETIDQIGHYAYGKVMACDFSKWTDEDDAIARTMEFARAREELQHPGSCKEGCQLDLREWQRGAEKGAQCKK